MASSAASRLLRFCGVPARTRSRVLSSRDRVWVEADLLHEVCHHQSASSRGVSTGRRDFFQRINEQHLAHELEQIGELARHGKEALKPKIFDPVVKTRPSARRPVTSRPVSEEVFAPPQFTAKFADDGSGNGAGSSSGGSFADFSRSGRRKPWLEYESLRGDTYPGGEVGVRHKGGRLGPRWQDLTHAEAQRMQEMMMRKRMLERKLLWMKMQNLPNPEKEAKMAMRQKEHLEKIAQSESEFQMYPPPFLDEHPESRRMRGLTVGAQKDEIESRFRNVIRQQKLENARIIKAAVPDVGGVTVDPIRRHVHRRLVRQRVKIHQGLEEVLTQNTAQVLYEFLRGVAISIVRITANRPRQTQNIHYNLTSDHDPAWVKRQLDILAPKLRSQLALKVNMGQTPNIRFVPQQPAMETRRSYLWKFARAIKPQVPAGGFGPRPASGPPSSPTSSL